MRFIKISQTELQDIRALYESVMSQACHGLFFREGAVLGREISEIASKNRDGYYATATNLMKARGWVEDIQFDESVATVKGSFEAAPGHGQAGCHRLRGMIREIYEQYHHQKVLCNETSCVSSGHDSCVFKITRLGD